jgi:vacuole morphology and inheritance protein 14
VLVCFSDPDSSVRYYVCESVYNIVKVVRAHIIPFFNDIFVGMCKLSTDGDSNIKNGVSLLDRLVKDIVADSQDFDIRTFIPLLKARITQSNPLIRQFLIGWITHLHSVPDIELIEYLPEFVDGWVGTMHPRTTPCAEHHAAISRG